MEFFQTNAVDFLSGDQNRSRDKRRVFGCQIDFRVFTSEKGQNRVLVVGVADNAQFVGAVNDRVGAGT